MADVYTAILDFYKFEEDHYSPAVSLTTSAFFSLLAFLFTHRLLGNPLLQQNFMSRGLKGRDLHRKDKPEMFAIFI
jgi:hypothetical protein